MSNKHPVPKYGPREITEMAPDKKQAIVLSLMDLRQMGPPRSDLELEDRLTKYFERCASGQLCPGIESMAFACGVSRQTIYQWSKGSYCSEERQNMIIAAKGMLAAFVEQSMQRGQINPAAGIFLMKNWFGYKDTRSFEIEQAEDTSKPALTADQIREKLRKDIPLDDDVDFREP